MKDRIILWMSMAAAMLLALSCVNVTETQVHVLPDSPGPRVMTPSLFTNVPDGLIEELGVEEGIPSSLCSFLVKKDGKNILFDSGNGVADSQLIPLLEIHGVKAEDIDYIFITHLHGDHIGGLTKDGKATFANAKVYLNKDEHAGWDNAGDMDMMKAYAEKVVLFDADDKLPCGIKAIKAYGHTPGHTMFRIGDMVFAGDIMHGTALQLVNPESCARFDQNQEQSAQTRKDALASFKDERLKVYGMHFPAPYYIQF